MKEIFSVLIYALMLGATTLSAATIDLDVAASHADFARRSFLYADWPTMQVGGNGKFPAQRFLIALQNGESASDIRVTVAGQQPLGSFTMLEDIPTSDNSSYDLRTLRQGQFDLSSPLYVIGEIEQNSIRYADILLFPITHSADGVLTLNRSITLTIASREISTGDLLTYTEQSDALQLASTENTNIASKYLIITSRSLESALQPLKRYRVVTGYQAEIVCIEDILALSSGVDDAEKLREYLKTYHAMGGSYVLLAGDETVLPIRFAYHFTDHADTSISPINLQVCDLYFADLTGDWDRDHDNTWGERLDDAADITPELLVGRLPFNRAEEFEAFTQKLIRFETNPGGSDRSYLARAFFYSSDQMRDYNDGQHNQIASAYPNWFAIDSVSGVEATRGDDPAPSNLAPNALATINAGGFGIINIIAHGRSDGFVLKSANYNEWPKTLMVTEPGDGHGGVETMTASNKPSFFYSLACDNAQFDCDQPYFGATAPNLCQTLLADSNGAVGFIGYTRWGWVGSSFLLQKAFYDSLFAHPEEQAVVAMNRSKSAYYFYRDMVYGLNYFGDPALRVYADVPGKLDFHADASDPQAVTVNENSNPVSGCMVILSLDDQLIETALSDNNGHAEFSSALDPSTIYTVSVSKFGFTTSLGYLVGQIATDVNDDNGSLPRAFSLMQNYPNPFNPSTTIAFDLPIRAYASLVIYNLLGQEVARPVDGTLAAGKHEVAWDASDIPTGVYFYLLQAGEFSATKKMLLLK